MKHFGISAISGVLMSVTFNNVLNCGSSHEKKHVADLSFCFLSQDSVRYFEDCLPLIGNENCFFYHAHLQKKRLQSCRFTVIFGTKCSSFPKHLQRLNQTCKKNKLNDVRLVLFLNVLKVWFLNSNEARRGCMGAQWKPIFMGDCSAWWCDVPKVPTL